MPKKRVHVTYDRLEQEWRAKAEGAQRAQATAETKAELLEQTIAMARRQGDVSVIIHNRKGTIQEERTYPRSSDPHPPKG